MATSCFSSTSYDLAVDQVLDGNSYHNDTKGDKESGEGHRVLGGEKHDGCESVKFVKDVLCLAKTKSGI